MQETKVFQLNFYGIFFFLIALKIWLCNFPQKSQKSLFFWKKKKKKKRTKIVERKREVFALSSSTQFFSKDLSLQVRYLISFQKYKFTAFCNTLR